MKVFIEERVHCLFSIPIYNPTHRQEEGTYLAQSPEMGDELQCDLSP